MKSKDETATIEPYIISIQGKVELNNKSDQEITVELFNKRYGCDIYSKEDAFFMSKYIDCKITMTEKFLSFENSYEQSYHDFMESLMEQGIIINNFKSTDNSRVEIYQKDIIKGKMKFKNNEGVIALLGRTPVIVKLFPCQKFEINFRVVAKQFKRNDNEFTSAH